MLTLDFLSARQPPAAATTITDTGLAQLLQDCGVPLDNGAPRLPKGAADRGCRLLSVVLMLLEPHHAVADISARADGRDCAVPELWPNAVFEWRCRVCRIWLTCAQITWVMSCMSAMPDRVEILVSSWARCVDRRNVNVPMLSLSVRFSATCSHLVLAPVHASASSGA